MKALTKKYRMIRKNGKVIFYDRCDKKTETVTNHDTFETDKKEELDNKTRMMKAKVTKEQKDRMKESEERFVKIEDEKTVPKREEIPWVN